MEYVNTTDDHPLIVAAVVHCQLVTIHPFADGFRRGRYYRKSVISERKRKRAITISNKNYKGEFTPIEVSRKLLVTNKTIINRLMVLVKHGFVVPILVNKRIQSYELREFTRDHEKGMAGNKGILLVIVFA